MEIAVRGWPEFQPKEYKAKEFTLHGIRRRLLVIDTESYPDQFLSLTFGSAKVIWLGEKSILKEPKIEQEVIFYADDLPKKDPEGYMVLVKYCRERKLLLLSQHGFCMKFLSKCQDSNNEDGKKDWAKYIATMFNLPHDVSRMAYGYGKPVGDGMKGGFSFRMFKEDDTIHPTFSVRSLDSRKSFTRGFIGLDIRTLVSAITDKSMSLRKAGEAFNIPEEYRKEHAERYDKITPEFIDYNRQDVTATAYLAAAVIKQYHRNPVATTPQKAYSAASLGKAYLEAMNIPPMLSKDVPKDNIDLGNWGSAFFGGRAEVRIRNTPVPVAYMDFLSMYTTVNALMGLWDFVTAQSIKKVEYTEQARKFFDELTLDDVLRKETWKDLTGFALIKPDGDLLPVRADYEGKGAYTVGVNYLHSEIPLWYSFPDLAASKLLTGKTPEIISAVKLVPGPKLSGLRPVKLLGLNYVDPAKEDFFTRVIEQRVEIKAKHKKDKPEDCSCPNCGTQTGLKCLSNGTSYGVYGEMNRETLDEKITQAVYGTFGEGWEYNGKAVETPGKYCYMPMAALITAAARLMLSILERMVNDLGGNYVFTDTDSMSPVALGPSPIEGVRALTLDEVTAIRERINSLNPYKGTASKALLKLEHQCWAYAISAKRYTLFNYEDGKPVVPSVMDGDRAYKEHALGLYLNPLNPELKDRHWMQEAWQKILDIAHGYQTPEPEWFAKPAMVRSSITKPVLVDRFSDINGGKAYNERVPYENRVKPFGFLLLAKESYIGSGGNRSIITGYEKDPDQWMKKDWYDLHDPDSPPLRIGRDVLVKTMGEVVGQYVNHPEKKSLAPDGTSCKPRTTGLLQRRVIHVTKITEIHTIGKESNEIEDQQKGIFDDPDDVYTNFGGPNGKPAKPTRWCLCGCGKPVPAGQKWLNKTHYRRWNRANYNAQSHEITDIGDWGYVA